MKYWIYNIKLISNSKSKKMNKGTRYVLLVKIYTYELLSNIIGRID